MELRDLVIDLVAGDLLAVRQQVADAKRACVRWDRVEQPTGLSEVEMSVAAAVVELLASRAGMDPPSWTATIGAVQEPFVLDPGLEAMPRSFARARAAGPEPFRKRNLVALPDFLDVA